MSRLRVLSALRLASLKHRQEHRQVNSNKPAKRGELRRRLSLELMEDRRLLAANVIGFVPNDSGFVVELSEEIRADQLNLYDTQGGAMGAADVVVHGATGGDVQGSLIVQGTKLTFVASGGPLSADVYTVTLRSAANGFVSSSDGALLDGENNGTLPSGNGTAGGDFVTNFTVGTSSGLVVGIPDFARGPTQRVQAPARGSELGLPDGVAVQLSNAAGVTSVTLTVLYDPSLLNVTAVQLGSDAPQGSQVEANLTEPGVVRIAFFSLAPMSAGQANILELIGSVPENATYGAAHVLQVTSLDVNGGTLAARADNALHVVAFAGDVNANRRYDAEDARLIARVGVGLDSGFVSSNPTSASLTTALFPTIDPIILGDVTGAGGISPLDASDVLRKVVGLPVPNLPNLPSSQAPFGLSLSNLSLPDNTAIGTTVGAFTTSDPDSGDTFTYSLVSGNGDTDNGAFTISGNSLVTAATLSSTKGSYSLRVKTTDATGKSFEKSFVISVSAINLPPTAIALSATSFPENLASGIVVATLSTTDGNPGDTHTYSLVSGAGDADNAAFTLSGNQLLLSAQVDFETKSTYNLRLRSTDPAGLFYEQAFTFSVTDANDAPTAISVSSTNITSGSASGTLVGDFSTVDQDAGDTHTYTLVAGQGDTDNSLFSISNNSLFTASLFDIATKTSYTIRVRSTDAAGQSAEQVIVGNVIDGSTGGNTAPTAIALSNTTIAENTEIGSLVATLSSTDANASDTHTYTLVAGEGDSDNQAFQIVGDELRSAVEIDFETQASFSIRVRSTDAAGLFVEQVFALSVTNINEVATSLSLSHSSVNDGSELGTLVGDLSANDPDVGDVLTYSLVAGDGDTDNASFTITDNQLLTAFTADLQTQQSYSVRVQVTDAAGSSYQQVFVVSVVELNQPPTGLALSNTTIAENTEIGSLVATLSSTDANASDTHTYTLVAGEGDSDNQAFQIVGDELRSAVEIDFETQASFSIRVRSTDAAGLFVEQVFALSVTNINEVATSLSLSHSSVNDGSELGTLVGDLSANDPDVGDVLTYSLVAGDGDTDNASFTITDNQLLTAFTADLQTQQSYSVRVQVTDAAGSSYQQVFVVSVVELNQPPTGLALSNTTIAENTEIGSLVATLSSTDANASDTHTYTLVAGEGDSDNQAFQIVGDELRSAVEIDFETQASFSIRVRSTDAAGLFVEQVFALSVTNINEVATSLSLSHSSVNDGSELGTLVGDLSANDPDVGDVLTYSLVAGDGDTDNASFTITDNQLLTAFTADLQTQQSYSVRVQVTDAAGSSYQQVFVVSVVEPNQPPTGLALSNTTIAENTEIGSLVATLSSTDANASDTHTYTLVAGEGDSDNQAFQIVGDELRSAVEIDFETQASFSIRVRSTDAAGLFVEQVFTLSVTNVNEAPTAISISKNTIADLQTAGAVTGVLSTEDVDAGDTFTYSLVAGEGDSDNAAFQVVDGQLVLASDVDAAIQSMYSVRLRSEDLGGLPIEQIMQILVSEANVGPTAVSLDNAAIEEGLAAGVLVGTLSTLDDNELDTHEYSLVSGEGDTDNQAFLIRGNQLLTATVFDFETQSSFTIRVRSTDPYGLSVEQVLTVTVLDVVEE